VIFLVEGRDVRHRSASRPEDRRQRWDIAV